MFRKHVAMTTADATDPVTSHDAQDQIGSSEAPFLGEKFGSPGPAVLVHFKMFLTISGHMMKIQIWSNLTCSKIGRVDDADLSQA